MGVTMDGEDLVLLQNPAFVLGTPDDELIGVLLHEVHHVVLGHLVADSADYPDTWARTVAEEVTVNEYIRELLPAEAIMLESFPQLPPLESTDRRYQRLRRVRRRPPIDGPASHRAGQGRSSGPSHLHTVDDHSSWAQARQDLARSQAAIRGIIQLAALQVGMDNIPPDLYESLAHFGIGSKAGSCMHEVQGDMHGRLNWRRVLDRYVGQALEMRPTFARPPRRFPDLIGVLPAWRRQAAKPNIMAIIDTSSSISAPLLEQVSGELAALARHFTVTIAECDSAVQRVYACRPLASVCGRRGTDFRPPLGSAFLRRHGPDLVVYFTDGAGPAPAAPPRCPVIWCLVPGGQPPAPWGRVIHMEET
jgi:predicted metal-dependent peptidase